MTKRVFFSFHYDDVISFRVNVVRNHGLLKETGTAGFFDSSIWEDAEAHGDSSVKRLINTNLENTTVTCVLIGSYTWQRRWVKYEILKSYDRGNKLLGININGISDRYKNTTPSGPNPFAGLGFFIDINGKIDSYQERMNSNWIINHDLIPTQEGYTQEFRNKGYTLSEWVHCYDWVADNGYENFSSWIENVK